MVRHVLAITTLVLLLGCGATAPKPELPPNFVIIMADDLGYGDLSTYGGWIDTPGIDRLAAEGLKFTDFHSNGAVCSPTRAALMTGRYQQRAGIPVVVFAPENRPSHIDGLQDVEYTFAEMLREQGYATGIFGKWHLGYYPEYNPVRHGFDFFKGYVSGNIDFFSHVDGAGRFDWWNGEHKSDEQGYVTTLINEHAVKFIEDHRDEPFCLYVPHEAPHYPYQGPDDDPNGFREVGGFSGRQELSVEDLKDRYRQMVEEMDEGVRQIIDRVNKLNLGRRTLVLFFSDNGATRDGSNGSLRGHKASVWEGGHRVPAIAWWPDRIAHRSVTDQLSSTMDVWPTLAELAGVPLPTERPLDGVSLAPLFDGGTLDRRPMYWHFMDGLAMREGDWKLVVGEDGNDEPMLFNLADDLGETNDLSESEPERVTLMHAEARDWLDAVNADATPQPSGEKSSPPE